ncbi:hypothetical protein Tco_1264755 [Tanacetum coccineum]
MQRPPLFEGNGFIYWKNRFETYVKSKDIDLWHIIVDGDYKPVFKNSTTGRDESVPYERQSDEHKKTLSKNNEAKMVLNDLPKKNYERVLMHKKAKDIWNSLVITHQESKDLSTLHLDELIGNLKVYDVVLEKDSGASKHKKERYKSLAKKESSDEEISSSGSEDEEHAMTFEHEHVVMNPTSAGMRHHHLHLYVDSKNLLDRVSSSKRRIFTHKWYLDLPCLLVLITGMSQSREHGKSESDSYYLSDYFVNSFTGPLSISS